ncbi:MAG: hypothetical protein H0W34_03505 [Pyrinomonadaceae bacterium]|nr:hypothetical protein [Pyrinomonadaceae bacterium]
MLLCVNRATPAPRLLYVKLISSATARYDSVTPASLRAAPRAGTRHFIPHVEISAYPPFVLEANNAVPVVFHYCRGQHIVSRSFQTIHRLAKVSKQRVHRVLPDEPGSNGLVDAQPNDRRDRQRWW